MSSLKILPCLCCVLYQHSCLSPGPFKRWWQWAEDALDGANSLHAICKDLIILVALQSTYNKLPCFL